MFRPDMDRFILEIQERPALWDVNSSDYSNKLMKNSAWEEICDLFVPDYSLLDLPEKKQAIADMQRKWKSLRDCFRRELSASRKSGPAEETGRKEYMYYKQLSFLLPVCSANSLELELTELTETKSTDKKLPERCSPPTKKPRRLPVEKLSNSVPAEDGPDRQFLLSLLPDLSSINEKSKLDAKVDIMNVLRSYKQQQTLQNPQ